MAMMVVCPLILFFFISLGLLLTCSTSLILLSGSTNKPPYVKLRRLLLSAFSFQRIQCLISFYKNRHRLLDWYTELLSQSPSQTIVVHRLGAPRTIVTANPDNVEYILKTKFANFPKGKAFTELLGDFLGKGIFNVDGEKWRIQRKLASHEFSAKSLRGFVVRVVEEAVRTRLVPVLEAAVEHDTVLDMQEVLRTFAFETICKVSLGGDICGSDLPQLAAAFDVASMASAARGTAPIPAVWKCKRALSCGSEKDLKEAVKLVHESIDQIIRSKKELRMTRLTSTSSNTGHDDDNDDLLSRFMEAVDDEEVVRDMVISFLMAGRDTTSSAMTWLFWLLTQHRDIETHLVDEVASLSIIDKDKEGISFEDLKEMNYTKACLCEAMRLYPPVVWDSKHAVRDDVLLDGTRVFRGDRVTYFQYGMGRMEELWGEDCLEFKPERWFVDHDDNENINKKELKIVSPYKFAVFQAGPRVCLGKEMAFIQMKYVVASLLTRFEFLPLTSDHPPFVPLLTAYMAGGFNVRVRKRTL